MNDNRKLSFSVEKNREALKTVFSKSFDILYKIFRHGDTVIMFVMADGMCDNLLVTQEILTPVQGCQSFPKQADLCIEYIGNKLVAGIDRKKAFTLDSAVENILSGQVAVFVDGADYCFCFGVQGFPKRSVEAAQTDVDERASNEAFTENLKDNIALLRRRLRTPLLKAELICAGRTGNTRICLCYLEDRTDGRLIESVKQKIANAKLDTVLASGYISEFLDTRRFAFFSAVGSTERPDIACAKMSEGRIIVVIDGTPFSLIVPFLFSEYFQTMDDYNFRPFYSAMTRLIKYAAFLISVFLPSVYIAVCTFHQEIVPVSMLYDIAVQESITPFPVLAETVFIHFVYEIVREAGVRMPKSVGNAVSIVGGLVIGQAAVDAGIIAAPMLIVMALSAISSFIIPQLYQPVAFLRFLMMLTGGFFGFYGIIIAFTAVLINTCRTGPFGIPLSAPVSPFSLSAMRDTFFRVNWRKMSKKQFNISDMER